MRARTVVLFLLVVLLLPGIGSAAPVSKNYVGPGELPIPCTGIGGACFTAVRGSTTVRVEVADDSGLPVGYAVWFYGVASEYLGTSSYCGDAVEIAVPEGTRVVRVHVAGPVAAPIVCPPGSVAPATKGTITLDFA